RPAASRRLLGSQLAMIDGTATIQSSILTHQVSGCENRDGGNLRQRARLHVGPSPDPGCVSGQREAQSLPPSCSSEFRASRKKSAKGRQDNATLHEATHATRVHRRPGFPPSEPPKLCELKKSEVAKGERVGVRSPGAPSNRPMRPRRISERNH